jgi:hypothetical protein
VLDHNDRVFYELVEKIKGVGHALDLNKRVNTLRVPRYPSRTSYTWVATLVFSITRKKTLDEVWKDGGKVFHVTPTSISGVEDCRSYNLRWNKEPAVRTRNREVRRVKVGETETDCIALDVKSAGVTDWMSYSDTLWELLTSPLFSYLVGGASARTQLQTSDTTDKYYLHNVVAAVRDGLLTLDNVGNIRNILDDMRRGPNGEKLHTDHLDGNIHNNLDFNLSMMLSGVDTSKGARTGWLYPPHKAWWAYDHKKGLYFAEITTYTEGWGYLPHKYKVFHSAEVLAEWLQFMLGAGAPTGEFTAHFLDAGYQTWPTVHEGRNRAVESARQAGDRLRNAERDIIEDIDHGSRLIQLYNDSPSMFKDIHSHCEFGGMSGIRDGRLVIHDPMLEFLY